VRDAVIELLIQSMWRSLDEGSQQGVVEHLVGLLGREGKVTFGGGEPRAT